MPGRRIVASMVRHMPKPRSLQVLVADVTTHLFNPPMHLPSKPQDIENTAGTWWSVPLPRTAVL